MSEGKSEGKSEEHKREGIGYDQVKQDGQVTAEEGVVMIQHVNGNKTIIDSKEQVRTAEIRVGDEIYWTADCTYTQQHTC